MSDFSSLSEVLRTVSTFLQTPVIALLIVLIAVSIIMVGTLLAEYFTERRRLRAKLPDLVDKIRDCDLPIEETAAASGLLKRQKAALLELTRHKTLTVDMREALARRLIFEEQAHYDRIVRITDLVAKLGPMLGLLGTLIPLGPGLLALGQGDTYTLSRSLLIAFDTTIAGLASAAVAFVISIIRRGWYENYMTAMETLMECVLERERFEAGGEEEAQFDAESAKIRKVAP